MHVCKSVSLSPPSVSLSPSLCLPFFPSRSPHPLYLCLYSLLPSFSPRLISLALSLSCSLGLFVSVNLSLSLRLISLFVSVFPSSLCSLSVSFCPSPLLSVSQYSHLSISLHFTVCLCNSQTTPPSSLLRLDLLLCLFSSL